MAVKRFKGAKAKADHLYSEVIRSVGECENCGKSTGVQLQCAHIISRRYSATRTDLRNAFCLCAGCHRRYTDFPREFSHFITDTWAAGFYDAVYAKAQPNTKVDWEERVEFLKDIKRALTEGEITLAEARLYEDT